MTFPHHKIRPDTKSKPPSDRARSPNTLHLLRKVTRFIETHETCSRACGRSDIPCVTFPSLFFCFLCFSDFCFSYSFPFVGVLETHYVKVPRLNMTKLPLMKQYHRNKKKHSNTENIARSFEMSGPPPAGVAVG